MGLERERPSLPLGHWMVAQSGLCHEARCMEEGRLDRGEHSPPPEKQRWGSRAQIAPLRPATPRPPWNTKVPRCYTEKVCLVKQVVRKRSSRQQNLSEPLILKVLCASSKGGLVFSLSQIYLHVDGQKEMEPCQYSVFTDEESRFQGGEHR